MMCNEHEMQQHRLQVKLAWAAGFFDGDGCTSITRQQVRGRKNRTFRLRLTMTQNCLETLETFKDVVDEQGFFISPPESLELNKRIHYLIYDGRHALAVLAKLQPHLVRKRMGALAAARFWDEGRMGTLPGPKGLPPEVWARREYWFKKIRQIDKR